VIMCPKIFSEGKKKTPLSKNISSAPIVVGALSETCSENLASNVG